MNEFINHCMDVLSCRWLWWLGGDEGRYYISCSQCLPKAAGGWREKATSPPTGWVLFFFFNGLAVRCVHGGGLQKR